MSPARSYCAVCDGLGCEFCSRVVNNAAREAYMAHVRSVDPENDPEVAAAFERVKAEREALENAEAEALRAQLSPGNPWVEGGLEARALKAEHALEAQRALTAEWRQTAVRERVRADQLEREVARLTAELRTVLDAVDPNVQRPLAKPEDSL